MNTNTKRKITHHWQLDVYKLSVEAAMRLFPSEGRRLHREYDRITGKLVTMQNNPDPWLLLRSRKSV